MRPGKLVLTSSMLVLSLPVLGAKSDTKSIPQSPTASDPGPVQTLQMYSRETVVDVLVTDDKGRPVRGLKQSDFSMQEDGKPQPVRSFGEFGPGFAATHHHPNLAPEIHTNYQATPTSGPVNILLIDALHLNFVAAYRALQATSQYAERMPPGTQIAVFWLSASGLHIVQGFTSDPSALRKAVSVERTDIGSNQDCYVNDRLTIDALNQIGEYVAGIKGRKNLVWITRGMPVFLLRDGGYSWGAATSCVENNPRGFSQVRSPYGIEIPGMSDEESYGVYLGPTLYMASEQGLDMGMVHRLMDTYETYSTEQIAVCPMDPGGVRGLGTAQLVAEQVAEQSGGFAKYNSNDFTGELAEAIDEGSHSYTLSYVPPRRKDDGHYHTIKVELNQPGLHLVYRKGYNAEDPRKPKEFSGPELIKAALQGKTPAATQLLFDAKLVPADTSAVATPAAPAKGKGRAPRTPYDLLLAVPQSQITYADGPDGTHNVRLQFAFDAYDVNG